MSTTTTSTTTMNSGLWSEDEHELYLTAMRQFTSWDGVARFIGTRSRLQCRTHHQKIEKKMLRARLHGARAVPRKEHRLPSTTTCLRKADHGAEATTPLSPHARQPISPAGVDGSMNPEDDDLSSLSFPFDDGVDETYALGDPELDFLNTDPLSDAAGDDSSTA